MQYARKNFSLVNGLICQTLCIEIAYSGEIVYGITILENNEDSKGAESESPDAFAKNVFLEFAEYFLGKRRHFDFCIAYKGTVFQELVWQEMLKIPYGETMSYGELAKRIGRPKAYRAVANACHVNGVCICVPCHRVVAKGGIGGYAPGVTIKIALLNLEKNVKEKI